MSPRRVRWVLRLAGIALGIGATGGGDIYVRTLDGRLFSLLEDPAQPLLVVGEEASFKVLASRARPRKKKPRRAEPDGA